MLRLLALVLPLCLDTFAFSAALGLALPPRAQRVRLGLLFAAVEGGMPLVGLLLGAVLGAVLGRVADYAAVVALAGVGLYMLFENEEEEEERARRLAASTGLAAIGLGLGASLDELAIGLTLGLLRVPVLAAVILIAAQAFLVSQLGLALGARVGERFSEGAEKAAGVALIALAAALLLTGFRL